MLDTVSRHVFERLVQMDPTALLPSEKEFLKSRRSYMSSEQRLKFTSILDETVQADPVPVSGTAEADLNDIHSALRAEAELAASTGTLTDAREKSLELAMQSEKERDEMAKTLNEADRKAREGAEHEAHRRGRKPKTDETVKPAKADDRK